LPSAKWADPVLQRPALAFGEARLERRDVGVDGREGVYVGSR
jgi:hypothetical protein